MIFFFAAVMSATIAISMSWHACSKTRMVWRKNAVALIANGLSNESTKHRKKCYNIILLKETSDSIFFLNISENER